MENRNATVFHCTTNWSSLSIAYKSVHWAKHSSLMGKIGAGCLGCFTGFNGGVLLNCGISLILALAYLPYDYLHEKYDLPRVEIKNLYNL
jgi:hypothetical protein